MDWTRAKTFFSIINVQYMSQCWYESTKQHVGEALMQIRKESFEESIKEEK